MAGVQFNEEPAYARYAPATSSRNKLMDLPIRFGIAKTERDALVVWIVLVVACVVVSVLFLATSSSSTATVSPSAYQEAAQHAGSVSP